MGIIKIINMLYKIMDEYLNSEYTDFFIRNANYILQIFFKNSDKVLVISGGIFGVYKYIKTKNQETYEKLLREVYSPLYRYIVKQEMARYVFDNSNISNYKELPILEFETYVDKKPTYIGGLSRKKFLENFNNINFGLAPDELYSLFSVYTLLVELEEKFENNKTEDIYIKSTLMKVDVENRLRRQIISGYEKYHKKLGIKPGYSDNVIIKGSDQITFKLTVDEKKKKELKEKYIKEQEEKLKMFHL